MAIRKSWSNIHFEMVYLLENIWEQYLKTVWEQGVQGVSSQKTAQSLIMAYSLILGLTGLGFSL